MSRPRQTAAEPLTNQQQKLIAAINRGVGSVRDLQTIAGYSSTSVAAYNLKLLAEMGHIVMLKSGKARRVYTGHEYSRAWDAACKAAGNPDA